MPLTIFPESLCDRPMHKFGNASTCAEYMFEYFFVVVDRFSYRNTQTNKKKDDMTINSVTVGVCFFFVGRPKAPIEMLEANSFLKSCG